MDVSSPSAVLRLLLPQVPFLVKTAILHSLWLSPTSTKWDLRTELIIRLLRALLDSPNPKPALVQQQASLKDPGIKGKMWVSKVTFQAPDDEARSLLLHAIEKMKKEGEHYTVPQTAAVEAEWTGYRAKVDNNRPRLDLSEKQHYDRLMSEVESDVTILYMHGGAHYLMDPASHRQVCSRLAHMTKGRCLSIRYRLAPQNPFPAALLDSLIAYLSLLYPPPDAYHPPVPASNIVFAGDSAGGNLGLALVQLLLQINRSHDQNSFKFHNHTVPLPLPLPAGCACSSAWADMTHAMPSKEQNYLFDYLPPPLSRDKVKAFPSDEIWPTKPARGDLYCETNAMCHPLVSPLAAEDWTGSCPLWLGYGEEMLVDEGKQIAAKAAKQGVKIVWEQWQAMPHCFALILLWTPMSRRFFEDWAGFCVDVVAAGSREKASAGDETKGIWFEAKSTKERAVDVRDLAVMSDDEVVKRMAKCREARHLDPEDWPKITSKL